ncbi:MAG: hypothetical protein DIU82_06765 [Bacillota bacterium]|nr:hypothetical protein [Bacillota bacterium]REJ35758.1 MAG: hypothetical protein DIU82_06765 [Bacillota bacterium]
MPRPGAGAAATLGLVLALSFAGIPGWTQGVQAHGAMASWRELRYTGVVPQTDWYTCGPAAAATLLHHYFGITATEAEILETAQQAMGASGKDPGAGITAYALVRALGERGLRVRGYRVQLDDLAAYFQQGGLPVILHVTRPEDHYVVAVGSLDRWVLLADPSWGRRLVAWGELVVEKGYSGVVLVPVPTPDLAAAARARQAEALAWAAGRLSQLARWGGKWR